MQTTAAPLSSVLPAPASAYGKPASAASPQADAAEARQPGAAFNTQLEQAQTRRDAGPAGTASVADSAPSQAGANTTDPLQPGVTDGSTGDTAVDAEAPVSGAPDSPGESQAVIIDPTWMTQPTAVPAMGLNTSAETVDTLATRDAVATATVGHGSHPPGTGAATDPAAWLDTLEQARRMAAGLPTGVAERAGDATATAPVNPASPVDTSVLAAHGAKAGPAIQQAATGKARGTTSPEPAHGAAEPAGEDISILERMVGTAKPSTTAGRPAGLQASATTAMQDFPAIRPVPTLQGDAMPTSAEAVWGATPVAGDAAGNLSGSAPSPVMSGLSGAAGSTAATAAAASDAMRHPGTIQILDEAALPYQLHHHLRWMQTRGQGTAELQLNPAELGPVHVIVKMEERRVEASFLCAQPMTRDLIEAAMPRLREAMESAGMELAGGFVGTGDFGQATDTQHSSHTGDGSRTSAGMTSDARADEPPVVMPRVVRHEGIVDTFA